MNASVCYISYKRDGLARIPLCCFMLVILVFIARLSSLFSLFTALPMNVFLGRSRAISFVLSLFLCSCARNRNRKRDKDRVKRNQEIKMTLWLIICGIGIKYNNVYRYWSWKHWEFSILIKRNKQNTIVLLIVYK